MIHLISDIIMIKSWYIRRWPWPLEPLPQKAFLALPQTLLQAVSSCCQLVTISKWLKHYNDHHSSISSYILEPFWVNGKLELGLPEASFGRKLWNLAGEGLWGRWVCSWWWWKEGSRCIPDICHFFTLTYFEAWKFYTQKCVNLRQKLPRDKIA